MGVCNVIRRDYLLGYSCCIMPLPDRHGVKSESSVEPNDQERLDKPIFFDGHKLDWFDDPSLCYALSSLELLGL